MEQCLYVDDIMLYHPIFTHLLTIIMMSTISALGLIMQQPEI